ARDIVQSSYRCSVPRDYLGDFTGGFVAHYLGRRKGRGTLASTRRTGHIAALTVDTAHCALCAWLPARQPARLAFGDPIAESRTIRALSSPRGDGGECILHLRFIATFKPAF